MSGIYAGAFFTLSADNAENADTRLMSGSSLYLKYDDVQLDYRNKEGVVTGEVVVRAYETLHHSASIVEPPMAPNLDTRGWTLQERTLSPRVLHFGDHFIWWECYGAYQCEISRTTISTDRFYQPHSTTPFKRPLSTGSKADIFQWWRRLITNYCFRRLTQPNDRLPAVSGIAAIVHSWTQSQYMTGIWRDDWVRSMLWNVDSSWGWVSDPDVYSWGRCQNNLSKYRAPSWSWAAAHLEGRHMGYPNTSYEGILDSYAASINANISTVGSDPFGTVSETTSLVVRARVCFARLREIQPPSPDSSWYGYQIVDGKTGEPILDETHVYLDDPRITPAGSRKLPSVPLQSSPRTGSRILLLYLCSIWDEHTRTNTAKRTVYSLILQSAGASENRTAYKGVGQATEWEVREFPNGERLAGSEFELESRMRRGKMQTMTLV